ncbi:MAG: hypothetical protein N2C14_08065 [Planctomycetales bacterium]
MKNGEHISCTIAETADYGAFGVREQGETIFIPFHELSWRILKSTSEVVQEGDVVTLVILRQPMDGYPTFLGSIRDVTPEGNPWHESNDYRIGSVHAAVVFQASFPDRVICELSTGAFAYTRVSAPHNLKPDDAVEVKLTGVSHENHTMEAVLVE